MRIAPDSLALASLLLVAVDAAPVRARAQEAKPRTAAEHTLRELVCVMNVGDPDTLRRFVSESFVTEGPTALPIEERVGRLTDAAIVEQLRRYLERMARRDVFSGAVLLARRGKPLYRAAFGEANKDFSARNTVDTRFNLGSMNKMFTAVSVLQLAEAGKLSLDDTLGKFLPAGTMRPEVLAKVRLKHLLSHTSGLGSYFTARWDSLSRALFRTVDDWMVLVKDDSLRFEPGTGLE